MKLSIKQDNGIIVMSNRYRAGEQITTVAGYAGSGKSTIIKYFIEQMGLSQYTKYVTFTGKASLVLQRKGLPATTIHRLIYNTFRNPHTGRFVFRLKSELEEDIRLIIVDEVSMVSAQLMRDLLTFGIPVICLGDPGQLEPIGEDNGLLRSPDVFLDEIHRQAEDNSIIRLSMLARTGQLIPLMKDDNVIVVNKNDLSFGMMQWADQILCGRNNTRRDINNLFREQLGRSSQMPVIGDKMICLRNYWDFINDSGMPLINGTIGTVSKVWEQGPDNGILGEKFIMDMVPDYSSDEFSKIALDTNIIKGNAPESSTYVKGKIVKPKIEMDYGYGITVHKSQGSEWGKVLGFEEVLRRDSHSKWLYTLITRASEKLVLVKAS